MSARRAPRVAVTLDAELAQLAQAEADRRVVGRTLLLDVAMRRLLADLIEQPDLLPPPPRGSRPQPVGEPGDSSR